MAAGEADTARKEASSLRKELETLQGRGLGSPKVERLREEVKRLELQLLERSIDQEFVQAKIELEVHRAVESERRKWEEEKLAEDRQRSVVSIASDHEQLTRRPNEQTAVGNVNNTAGVGADNQVSTMNASTTVAANGVHSNNTTTTSAGVQVTSSVPHVYPFPCNIPLMESMAVPPIGKFSGEHESEAGEHFTDWIEQFELVASVCHWDDRTKLVNLTTRLRGQAFAFYRSCSTQQRNDYKTLVSELKKRFTPVRLQAVQSSLFHD